MRRMVEPRRQSLHACGATIVEPQMTLIVEGARRVVSVPREMASVGGIARMLVGEASCRGQVLHLLPAAIYDGDVAAIHHPGLGVRVDRQRNLAAIGRDVV